MKRRFHILVVTVLTFVMVVNGFFIGGKSDAVWANDLSVESLVNNETGMTVSVEADFVIENGVLKQYNGTAQKVIIPDGVTEIAENVFKKHAEIHYVIFPDSLKKIGYCAFGFCSQLFELDFNQVELIGESAFTGCNMLDGLVFPSTVRRIEEGAFGGCEGLKYIVFEEGIESIGAFAFHYAPSLSLVKLAASIEEMGEFAFAEPNFLKVYVPKELKVINSSAFSSLGYLIPESMGGGEYRNAAVIYGYTDCGAFTINEFGMADLTGEDGVPSVAEFVNANECNIEDIFNYKDYDITLKGDANKDGKTDLRDAKKILECALGIVLVNQSYSHYIKTCDYNLDYEIDLEDAQWILKKALGIIE